MQINRKLSADIPEFARYSRCVGRIGAAIRVQRASRAWSCARRIIRARPTCSSHSPRVLHLFPLLVSHGNSTRAPIRDKEQCNGTIERGELIVVPILHAKFIPVYHIRLTATEYTRQAIVIAISFDERTSNESRWRDLGPYSYAHSSRREAKWHDDSRP